MSQVTQTPPLSSAQIGELALDAAIQIDRFIASPSGELNYARELLVSIVGSLRAGALSESQYGKFELSYLPIYERAILGEEQPVTVHDFSAKVISSLERFLEVERGKDEVLLPDLRDFCLAVHEEALSERLDVISSTQPTLRRDTCAH